MTIWGSSIKCFQLVRHSARRTEFHMHLLLQMFHPHPCMACVKLTNLSVIHLSGLYMVLIMHQTVGWDISWAELWIILLTVFRTVQSVAVQKRWGQLLMILTTRVVRYIGENYIIAKVVTHICQRSSMEFLNVTNLDLFFI